MTGMAMFGNYIRTRGEDDSPTDELVRKAVKRMGGYGMYLEAVGRAATSVEQNGVAGVATAVTGPVVGDFLTAFKYGKGLATIAGTRVPFYTAGPMLFGKDAMDNYEKDLKDIDNASSEYLSEFFGSTKAAGSSAPSSPRVKFADGGAVEAVEQQEQEAAEPKPPEGKMASAIRRNAQAKIKGEAMPKTQLGMALYRRTRNE
jgi:hypothetical protein